MDSIPDFLFLQSQQMEHIGLNSICSIVSKLVICEEMRVENSHNFVRIDIVVEGICVNYNRYRVYESKGCFARRCTQT